MWSCGFRPSIVDDKLKTKDILASCLRGTDYFNPHFCWDLTMSYMSIIKVSRCLQTDFVIVTESQESCPFIFSLGAKLSYRTAISILTFCFINTSDFNLLICLSAITPIIIVNVPRSWIFNLFLQLLIRNFSKLVCFGFFFHRSEKKTSALSS